MFYNITGIIVGLFVIISSIILVKGNKKVSLINVVSFISGFGLLTVGIVGFFIPKDYEFITQVFLLIFVGIYCIAYMKTNQKDNNPSKR